MKLYNKYIQVLILLSLIIISICILSKKESYNIDELFSYGLANNIESIAITIPENEIYYENPLEPFYDYMVVSKGESFNYRQVWLNQKADVHPPLYYAILHTICSFFPDTFSVWFAGVINICSIVLTLFFFQKIMDLLYMNKRQIIILSVIFVLNSGIHTSISFLRMYALVMMWITLTTYLYIKLLSDLKNNKLYLLIGLVSICGSLTHYYYIIFLFFMVGFFLIYLFIYDRKLIRNYLLIYFTISIITFSIFPEIIRHMFLENRGSESVENFVHFSLENYMNRFVEYFKKLDYELFAGKFFLLIILVGIFSIIYIISKKICREKNVLIYWKWFLVIFPSIFYFILVVHIAVYIDLRYIMPIYPLLLLTIYGYLFKLLAELSNQYITTILYAIISFYILLSTILNNDIRYMYLPNEYQTVLSQYSEINCIYIHNNSWHIQASYNELSNYKAVTYITEDAFINTSKSQILPDKEYILIISSVCDKEAILEELKNYYGIKISYNVLGSFGYSDTYYISSTP